MVQVTVADGSHKMKMLLHSDLNTQVQKHEASFISSQVNQTCILQVLIRITTDMNDIQ